MKPQFMLLAVLTVGSLLLAIAPSAAGESAGSREPVPGESAYAERAERLLAAAIETGDELGTARAQYLMAQHMRALRLHSQALVHARLAQDGARRVEDEQTLLAADIAYGASLGQLTRTAEAIEILLPSLEQARALENIEQQLRALLALSTSYFHANQISQAVDYARQGLTLARAEADRTHTASFLSNLGLLAYTQGDLVAASAFVQDALALEDLPPDIQRTLTSASITLAGPAEAESRAHEAIAAAREAENTFHEGFATAQLGHILCSDGRLDEAASAFTAADRLLREADAITDLQRTYEVWAECLQQAGSFEDALAHQREARTLLEQAHERRQDEIRQAHEIAFRTEQRLSELARLTADEQTLQTRIARQRALTGWLAAGALLLAGVLTGRNRHLREQHRAQQTLQQARVDLLARTSHEIRNPTQGIIGILEGVQDGDAPLERRRLDTVLSAARMVGHLANEYLDLALLEQGKLRIDSDGLCHLPDLVEQLETLSAAFIRAPGQTLTTQIGAQVPDWIHTDGKRLAQVLLNLISNAAHYAGDGEITLTVTAKPEAGILRYCVADRGPGFDLSDAASFDPYARGSRHSSNPRGSGLGLAISARIVHAMGGTIVARNRRSGGAELVLTFPLRAASETRELPDQASRPQAFPAPATTAHTAVSPDLRRVLIIDDDPFARLGLQSLVESLGGQIEELDSGRDVEQCLQRFDPHVVLVDYQLGDTTGIDIANRIRRHDAARDRHRLIVIVSGTGRAAEEHQTDSVADQWLLKPVGRETMLELLGVDIASVPLAPQGV